MFIEQRTINERFVIHQSGDKVMVGGVNYVYDNENDYLIIEDRYPLTKETIPYLIEELEAFIEEVESEDEEDDEE